MAEYKSQSKYEGLLNDILNNLSKDSLDKVAIGQDGKAEDWDGTHFKGFFDQIWAKNSYQSKLAFLLNKKGLLGSKNERKRHINRIVREGVDFDKAYQIFSILSEALEQDNDATLIQLIKHYDSFEFQPAVYSKGKNQEIVNEILGKQNRPSQTNSTPSTQTPASKWEGIFSKKSISVSSIALCLALIISGYFYFRAKDSLLDQANLLINKAYEYAIEGDNRLGILLTLESLDISEQFSDLDSELANKSISLLQSSAGNYTEKARIELPEETEFYKISSDSKLISIATAIPEKSFIKTTRISDGKEVFSLDISGMDIKEISFNEQGTKFLILNSNNGVTIWDVSTGQKIKAFPDSHKVKAPVFTKDFQHAFTLNYLNAINAWRFNEELNSYVKTDAKGFFDYLDISGTDISYMPTLEDGIPQTITVSRKDSAEYYSMYLKEGKFKKVLNFDADELHFQFTLSEDLKYIAIPREDGTVDIGLRDDIRKPDQSLTKLHKTTRDGNKESYQFQDKPTIQFHPPNYIIAFTEKKLVFFDLDGEYDQSAEIPYDHFINYYFDRHLLLAFKGSPDEKNQELILLQWYGDKDVVFSKPIDIGKIFKKPLLGFIGDTSSFFLSGKRSTSIYSKLSPSGKTKKMEGIFYGDDDHFKDRSTIGISNNSNFVAAANNLSEVKIWNRSTGNLHLSLETTFNKPFDISFSKNDSMVTVNYREGVSIIDLKSGKEIFYWWSGQGISLFAALSSEEKSVQFFSYQEGGNKEGYMRIQKTGLENSMGSENPELPKNLESYDYDQYYKFLEKYKNYRRYRTTNINTSFGFDGAITSNTGHYFIEPTTTQNALLLDRVTGEEWLIDKSKGKQEKEIVNLKFSPNDDRLILFTFSREKKSSYIEIYNLETKKIIRSLDYTGSKLMDLEMEFSENGKLVGIYSSKNNNLKIIDLESGEDAFSRSFLSSTKLSAFTISPDSSYVSWIQTSGSVFASPIELETPSSKRAIVDYYRNLNLPPLTEEEKQRFSLK